MSRQTVYLVVRADRTVRAAKRPRVAADEVAIPINLHYPDRWGRVLTESTIDLRVPDFAPDVVPPQRQPGAGS